MRQKHLTTSIFFIVSLLWCLGANIQASASNSSHIALIANIKNAKNCPAPFLVKKDNLIILGHSESFQVVKETQSTLSKEDACSYKTIITNKFSDKDFNISEFSFLKVVTLFACVDDKLNAKVEHSLESSQNSLIYKNTLYDLKDKKISETECYYKI